MIIVGIVDIVNYCKNLQINVTYLKDDLGIPMPSCLPYLNDKFNTHNYMIINNSIGNFIIIAIVIIPGSFKNKIFCNLFILSQYIFM